MEIFLSKRLAKNGANIIISQERKHKDIINLPKKDYSLIYLKCAHLL